MNVVILILTSIHLSTFFKLVQKVGDKENWNWGVFICKFSYILKSSGFKFDHLKQNWLLWMKNKRELRYISKQFSLKHWKFEVLILLHKPNSIFQSMQSIQNHAVIILSLPACILSDMFVFMTKINSSWVSLPLLV